MATTRPVRPEFRASDENVRPTTWRGSLYRASGPSYASQYDATVQATEAGSATLEFDGANSATLRYTVDGAAVTKRISRMTAESLPWWLRLFGTLIGASVDAARHEAGRFCGVPMREILERRSLTEVACRALFGREPGPADAPGTPGTN